MKKHNQKGFAHLGLIILILVVIGALVFVYFRVLNKNKAVTPTTADTSTKPSTKNSDEYNWSSAPQGPYHDKVSFVTSSSLTSWSGKGTLLAKHASVPDVIIKDGKIFVYFVDVSQDGKPEQIGLLTSSNNGKTWSEKQYIAISGIGDKAAVDPAPTLLSDGRVRLYYYDISTAKTEGTSKNTIYSAISDDGINFTQEDGARFTYANIFDPDVVKEGGTWRLYVGTDSNKVLSATSSDGLDFSYEGEAFSGGATPNVIAQNSTYYLFTSGILISSSNSGKTFKQIGRFDTGGLTADPGVTKMPNGNYILVFKTSDQTQPTSPPVQ